MANRLPDPERNQKPMAMASIGVLLYLLVRSSSARLNLVSAWANSFVDPCQNRLAMTSYLKSGRELTQILDEENTEQLLSPVCTEAIFYSLFDIERAATFSEERKAQIIDFLAEYNTRDEFDIFGKIPLLNSIFLEDREMVELLIDKGTNIDPDNGYGIDALYRAVESNSLDLVELLIERGVEVDPTSSWPTSALHQAAQNYNIKTEIVELLLEEGAKINARDSLGKTPLHYAVDRHGDAPLDVVELLLNRGAKVDAEDNDDYTPLRTAVYNRNRKLIKLLIENGADPNHLDYRYIKDNYGFNKGRLRVIKEFLEEDFTLGNTTTEEKKNIDRDVNAAKNIRDEGLRILNLTSGTGNTAYRLSLQAA